MKKGLLFLLIFSFVSSAFSQVIKKDDFSSRRFEPVVVGFGNFANFLNHGLKMANFYFYAFDSTTSSWRAVPFQIDDRIKVGSKIQYYFGASDTVDQYDELVFMAKDLGDRVPDGYWISNNDSRNQLRYEIQLDDTLRNDSKAWGYLFYSGSITDFVTDDYLQYVGSDPNTIVSDKVISKFYEVDFWSQNGLPIHAIISSQNGGSGIDILDRIKFRVQVGDIKIYGISYNKSLNVSEENLHKETVKVIDSKVRVIRDMRVKISVNAFNVYTYEDTAHFPIYFYPYNFKIESDNISLNTDDISDVDMNIKLIRTSMDLNQNSNGMKFYNKYNRYEPEEQDNRNRINGMGGSNILYHTLDVPGLNWFMVTGDPGSIFSTTTAPKIGDLQLVYFYDYNYSSGPQTWDGTPDTGDKASWGDSGIRINGANIKGEFSMLSNTYFLPKNQPVEAGDTLNANIVSPVAVYFQSQQFDRTAPAVIADLIASPISETAINLIWTAPGDDGTSGTAARYEIRYSQQAPVPGDEEIWFAMIATKMNNVPKPSPAGIQESLLIDGLQMAKKYYFAIRTYDEANVNSNNGNASPISNIATATSLAVQLADFAAAVFTNAVVLTWQTASENDNYGFEIQRKQGSDDYASIAFMPGHGTTSETNYYSFEDKKVAGGTYFYRLKQIDLDGTFHFLAEVQVAVALPSEFALHQNYPNPFNPTTTIAYDLAEDSRVNLTIYNANGQVMTVVFDGIKEAGQYSEQISASGWPSGIYFARLTAGSHVFVRKMILLE